MTCPPAPVPLIACVLLVSATAVLRGDAPPPNYWCTWSTQSYSRPERTRSGENAVDFTAGQGARSARARMTEAYVFGPTGWARTQLPPDLRADLYLLLDDGWDVPFDVHPPAQRHRFGSLVADPTRFPSATGTPVERLRALAALAREAGWRGLGLWIACQTAKNRADDPDPTPEELEAYWRERLAWSRDAGIRYWKVDWGAHADSLDYRATMARLAREISPELLIEHAHCQGPFNDGPDGRWGAAEAAATVATASLSPVLRTYDVSWQLSLPTTLERVATLLQAGSTYPGGTYLNTEDEGYLGAALGLTLGVMRSPDWAVTTGPAYDPHDLRRRGKEVERALRWQQLAPPWRLGPPDATIGSRRLTDHWTFRPGETWVREVQDITVAQSAPAVVARGVALPVVEASGEPPYVVASRHPNSLIALALLPRIGPDRALVIPPAAVTWDLAEIPLHLAIFGRFATLELRFPTGPAPGRWLAQDLADPTGDWTEVTATPNARGWIFAGPELAFIGRSAQAADDPSAPGLQLRFEPAASQP